MDFSEHLLAWADCSGNVAKGRNETATRALPIFSWLAFRNSSSYGKRDGGQSRPRTRGSFKHSKVLSIGPFALLRRLRGPGGDLNELRDFDDPVSIVYCLRLDRGDKWCSTS